MNQKEAVTVTRTSDKGDATERISPGTEKAVAQGKGSVRQEDIQS